MKKLFKIAFINQGQIYELYSRSVVGSDLAYGFVEVSELVFENDHSVVIDPSEERLRTEFEDVEVLHLPLHSSVRIEQVKKRGKGVIRDSKSGDKVRRLQLGGPRRKS